MKKFALIFSVFLVLFSCKSDDDNQNDNPFLFNPIVSLNLNLNLPQFNELRFPGSSVVINTQGVKGIVVYCINENFYTASDLSDPNHIPNDCSRMDLEGILLSCPCPEDTNVYDVVTGKHQANNSLYPLQQYRAERTGDDLRIFN
jgi:hypothetical protein